MLRIHFTVEDVALTRVASGPDPMWEIVSSVQLLQSREGGVAFDRWRRYARAQRGAHVHALATVAPNANYFPDFLTPAEGCPSVERGIKALLATPHRRLRTELNTLGDSRPLPRWVWRLADGDQEAMAGFGELFRSYFRTQLRAWWGSVEAQVDADRTRRMHAFAVGGINALLASFRPVLRWEPPVLEADYPVDRDVYLRGRGLLLTPVYFCWRTPITLVDPDLPPVLAHPISRDLRCEPVAHRNLSALLGTTRAAVLCAALDGGTTTQLARRARTSIASASRHAMVLREAGLLTASRHDASLVHTVTTLGAALCTGESSGCVLPVSRPRGG